MIQAYTGFPGSGKTFACTHIAWKEIRKGRTVFTNYAVKGAYKITYDDLVNYTFPVDSVVIIDEAGRYFNSRDWGKLPPAVFDLFTLHRHMKLDLIVAVQNFQRIDVALREVIELVWWARNIPLVPWFIYDGYYGVEKLGMKGEANKRQLISKVSRSRKAYDTHAMRSVTGKDHIPLIPWETGEEKQDDSGGTTGTAEDGGELEPSLSIWERIRNRLARKQRGVQAVTVDRTLPHLDQDDWEIDESAIKGGGMLVVKTKEACTEEE